MRLTGFASGLDINQMVSDLMKAQRMPMNKLTQQKQLLEWKRDDYRDLNRLMNDFRNLSFDMTLQRTYSQKLVNSSNSKVSAIASSTAANASYTISNVKVATAASNSSSGFVKAGEKLDATKSIWEQRGVFSDAGAADMWSVKTATQREISFNSETSKFKLAKGAVDGSTMTELEVEIEGEIRTLSVTTNEADLANHDVFLNEKTGGELTFKDALPPGSKIREFTYDHFTFDFAITSYNRQGEAVKVEFEFDGTATMNEVMDKINSSTLGITSFYDEQSNTLMMTKREAGSFKGEGAAEIEFSGTFLENALQLDSSNEVGGDPAQVTINGVTTTRNSNTFTVNGVTFTLNEDMQGETAVISVGNDTDKTFDSVKNYIEKYNELIEKINSKLGEPVYRDYKPLTNEEREALTEKQQEQWEEKARSGLLRNDSILSSGMSNMRMNFYEPISGVTGAFSQLSQIGISTGSNYMDKGKLIIDEEKLREAIEKDSASVMQMFTANGENNSSQGLARRLRDSVTSTIQGIEARAGNATRTNQQFTIGRELLDVDKRITTFKARLQQIEARYWRQFNAMEQAINQSNNQSAQLMSQFYN